MLPALAVTAYVRCRVVLPAQDMHGGISWDCLLAYSESKCTSGGVLIQCWQAEQCVIEQPLFVSEMSQGQLL